MLRICISGRRSGHGLASPGEGRLQCCRFWAPLMLAYDRMRRERQMFLQRNFAWSRSSVPVGCHAMLRAVLGGDRRLFSTRLSKDSSCSVRQFVDEHLRNLAEVTAPEYSDW